MIETIIVSTIIAVVGVFIGSRVQRMCRFIYPIDGFTVGLLVAMAADTIAILAPWDKFWYLPLILGYAAGYLVVGRTAYIMVWTTSLSGKYVDMRPWVIWTENGSTYLQEQTNRALFSRLLFGVKHEIVSNVPLETDWIVDAKYPLFPQFSRPTAIAEEIRTSYVRVRVLRWFEIRKYTTHVAVAYAGTVSKMQLAQDERALKDMQRQNTELIGKVHELTSQQGPMLMEMALRLEQEIGSSRPVNRMYDLIRMKRKGGKNDTEKDGTEQTEQGSP